jgi:hypothetical protein
MIEDRPGQNQPIEQCNRHAHLNSGTGVAQHSAGGGAVNVQNVVVASVTRRDDKRLAINRKANVAYESFVKNLVDNFAIIIRALGLADYAGTRCRR